MNVITQGEQALASTLNENLQALSESGAQALQQLLGFKEVTLMEYQNAQSYINSRRMLINRRQSAYAPVVISASDFACVDQGLTTGSIRADAGTVTTRETTNTFTSFAGFVFSSSGGIVTPIDINKHLYTVISNTTPTGQFDVTLEQTIDCQLVSFDVLANPGDTTFVVSTSPDNLNYTAWTNVSANGYRVTAFGNSSNTKYIRIQITPGAPDGLSGIDYSFGLTDLTARGSEFALQSEFNSRTMPFTPNGPSLYFGGTPDPGITYYVSISTDGTGEFVETPVNSLINLPQVQKYTTGANQGFGGGYALSGLLEGYYPTTITCYEVVPSGYNLIPFLPGVSRNDPNFNKLKNDFIYLYNNQIWLYTLSSVPSRLFDVTFYAGPQTLYVKVKAVLDTSSYGSTPSFNQVYFEVV